MIRGCDYHIHSTIHLSLFFFCSHVPVPVVARRQGSHPMLNDKVGVSPPIVRRKLRSERGCAAVLRLPLSNLLEDERGSVSPEKTDTIFARTVAAIYPS